MFDLPPIFFNPMVEIDDPIFQNSLPPVGLPEVAGDRCLQSEQLQCPLLGVERLGVELVVGDDDALGTVEILTEQDLGDARDEFGERSRRARSNRSRSAHRLATCSGSCAISTSTSPSTPERTSPLPSSTRSTSFTAARSWSAPNRLAKAQCKPSCRCAMMARCV